MTKIGIISLFETDIINIISSSEGSTNNISNLFPDATYISFVKLSEEFYQGKESIECIINNLQSKYDKILIVNGLEDLDKEYIFNFEYLSGKDTNDDIQNENITFNIIKTLENSKICNIIEELISNEECEGINSLGFVKKSIEKIYQTEYISEGGLYIRTETPSNVYVSFNALKNLESFTFPHFSIIYNYPHTYKVGICLWGNLSSWAYVKNSFKNNILKDLDADVFVYGYGDKNSDNDFSDIPVRDIVIEEKNINNFYDNQIVDKLKGFKTFNDKIKDLFTGITVPKGISEYHKMYYSSKCNELRKNYQQKYNVSYDLVIHCNLNLLYFNSLDIDRIRDDTLYTCYGVLCNNIDPNFYLADPYIIDKICDNFYNLDLFYNNNKDEEFSISTVIDMTIKDNNFNIGSKVVNCSLQRDKNTLYKHPGKWIYLSNDQLDFFYNYFYNIADTYKIQKVKDELIK